jgi:hypothetical protein
MNGRDHQDDDQMSRLSVVAKAEQGDDDRVEGEGDECVTADDSAGQSCFDDDV